MPVTGITLLFYFIYFLYKKDHFLAPCREAYLQHEENFAAASCLKQLKTKRDVPLKTLNTSRLHWKASHHLFSRAVVRHFFTISYLSINTHWQIFLSIGGKCGNLKHRNEYFETYKDDFRVLFHGFAGR
jgi:hypothetical protein